MTEIYTKALVCDIIDAQKDPVDYWHYGYRAKMSRIHVIFIMKYILWWLTKAKISWELILYDQTKYFDLLKCSSL